MSLQAYLFFFRLKKAKWSYKKACYVYNVVHHLLDLQTALLHNPSLSRMLPLLMTYCYSKITKNSDCSALGIELSDHIWQEEALLWVTFRSGIDCLQEQWINTTQSILLLQRFQLFQAKGFDPLLVHGMPLLTLEYLNAFLVVLPDNTLHAFIEEQVLLLRQQRSLFAPLLSMRRE